MGGFSPVFGSKRHHDGTREGSRMARRLRGAECPSKWLLRCAKGAELALERDALLRKAEALAADTTAPDRATAILDPTQANAVAPGRMRRKGASSLDGIYERGGFQRDALEAIRTATGPISAHGIVRDMARKGLALDDYATRRPFEKRVSALLSNLKARGVLVNGTIDGEGRQAYVATS